MQCHETICHGVWGKHLFKQGYTELEIRLDIVGFMLKGYHILLCDIMKLDLVGFGVHSRIFKGLVKGNHTRQRRV